jgi:hypothetical protein
MDNSGVPAILEQPVAVLKLAHVIRQVIPGEGRIDEMV